MAWGLLPSLLGSVVGEPPILESWIVSITPCLLWIISISPRLNGQKVSKKLAKVENRIPSPMGNELGGTGLSMTSLTFAEQQLIDLCEALQSLNSI